jgi:phosphoserine phosphatase
MLPRDDTPVVVFDLDGTILRVNSFPRWVLFLIVGRLPGLGLYRRMLLSLRTLSLLLRRKLARASHEDFLWRLQDVVRSVCAALPVMDRFEASLLRQVRPNLAMLLQLVTERRIETVLATAAPEDYAAGVGRRLGFRFVLATRANRRRGEPGNSGINKRAAVTALFAERGWSGRPVILFTDHADDLPLMRDSIAVYWCGPRSALERAAVAAANIQFVFCGDLSSAEIAARVLEACQLERLPESVAS